MLKKKEYRTCDRCFKELDETGHVEICDTHDMYFVDLCDDCYDDYKSYTAEIDDINQKRHEIAKKYKFGPYLPRENEVEND